MVDGAQLRTLLTFVGFPDLALELIDERGVYDDGFFWEADPRFPRCLRQRIGVGEDDLAVEQSRVLDQAPESSFEGVIL